MGMGRKACVDMVGCGGPFNKETDDHFRSGAHMRKVLRDYAKRKKAILLLSHYPSPH